jgi:hypothetical protein
MKNKASNYCTSTEAVLEGSCYNTKTGIAVLNFELPKGHDFGLNEEESNRSKNELHYFCKNDVYSNDTVIISPIKVIGLQKVAGAKLKIYLKHSFKTNKCNNNSFSGDKIKTSIIVGEPLAPCE